MDARLDRTVEEAVHDVVVEEHLRRQKRAAGVHFFLQMGDILRLVMRLDMAVGVAGAADAEAVERRKLGHELGGIPVLARTRLGDARGTVAAQRKDVFDAQRRELFRIGMHLVTRRRQAGHVRDRRHAARHHLFADGRRRLRRGAGRTVGDADKGRGERGDAVDDFVHMVDVRTGFRRENLTGEGNAAGLQDFADFHLYSSLA